MALFRRQFPRDRKEWSKYLIDYSKVVADWSKIAVKIVSELKHHWEKLR